MPQSLSHLRKMVLVALALTLAITITALLGLGRQDKLNADADPVFSRYGHLDNAPVPEWAKLPNAHWSSN